MKPQHHHRHPPLPPHSHQQPHSSYRSRPSTAPHVSLVKPISFPTPSISCPKIPLILAVSASALSLLDSGALKFSIPTSRGSCAPFCLSSALVGSVGSSGDVVAMSMSTVEIIGFVPRARISSLGNSQCSIGASVDSLTAKATARLSK